MLLTEKKIKDFDNFAEKIIQTKKRTIEKRRAKMTAFKLVALTSIIM